jgi:hypothetical protein
MARDSWGAGKVCAAPCRQARKASTALQLPRPQS